MITNHTSGNLILRQPGTTSEPATPDETLYRAVGAEMAAENGYSNVFSYQIGYDHVGTTDGWSYYTTGGLGYVFEIGNTNSHPPYAEVVQNYDGSAVPGGGNSEAFYVAMESAANPAHHAVVAGNAPPGTILRLTKSFTNRTSVGPPTNEHFDTTTEVPALRALRVAREPVVATARTGRALDAHLRTAGGRRDGDAGGRHRPRRGAGARPERLQPPAPSDTPTFALGPGSGSRSRPASEVTSTAYA